ncbi:uncharacterized protein [Rutidosis leptorrhynchoides]|uniref:uncharacterized protein isoform X3 n=1 Tax=Rutidosis leptorrhynchoides TaxID=125765 RepID=UPI003A990A08
MNGIKYVDSRLRIKCSSIDNSCTTLCALGNAGLLNIGYNQFNETYLPVSVLKHYDLSIRAPSILIGKAQSCTSNRSNLIKLISSNSCGLSFSDSTAVCSEAVEGVATYIT